MKAYVAVVFLYKAICHCCFKVFSCSTLTLWNNAVNKHSLWFLDWYFNVYVHLCFPSFMIIFSFKSNNYMIAFWFMIVYVSRFLMRSFIGLYPLQVLIKFFNTLKLILFLKIINSIFCMKPGYIMVKNKICKEKALKTKINKMKKFINPVMWTANLP